MRSFFKKGLLATLFLGLSLITLAGCGNSNQKTIKLGIMGSDKRAWQPAIKTLKKEGINLQLVSFTDYSQPNAALQNHQIDANAFQHHLFLDSWNKAHKSNIVPVGNTTLAPLAIYSQKIKNINQLKSGDTVTLPNDASNEGRALNLLKDKGLIKLDSASLPTTKDVIENKKHLKLVAMDAAQTARSLSDSTAAIINDNFALDAKIPKSEIIGIESVNKNSYPYINFIAANKSDKNKKIIKELVKAYQTNETKKVIEKIYDHRVIPAWGLKLK